jgi:hypothetical protein
MESFKVTHLTNRVYTQWGQLYSSIKWNCFWDNILKQVEKELTENDYIHLSKQQRQKTLVYIIYWFDINILQKFPIDDTKIKDETFDVNMRIICGMVNNLNYDNDFKIKIVECFHDAFKRFYIEWMNWRCLRIWNLPF